MKIAFRLVIAGFVALVLLEPAAALAGAQAGTCRRISRQIEQYENVVEMAESRDDALWENATLAQIDRLSLRRERLCPEYKKPNKALELAKSTNRLMKLAAKAAITYFTGGFDGLGF